MYIIIRMTAVTRFSLMVFCTHVLTGLCSSSELEPVTCEAGSFQIGDDASVTCHFGLDISNSQHIFEIMRYPFESAKDVIPTGIDVLRCHRDGEDWKCDVEQGFDFDYQITENATVVIRNVTADLSGAYACQLIPSDGRKRSKCNLFVGDTSWTELTERPEDTQGSNGKRQGISQTKDQSPLLIAIVVLGVLLVASIVVNVVVCVKYRSSRNGNNKKKSKDNGFNGLHIRPYKEGDDDDVEDIPKPSVQDPLLRTRLLHPELNFKPTEVQKTENKAEAEFLKTTVVADLV